MGIVENALAQDFSRPMNVVIGSLPLSLMELADQLLAETENLGFVEDRVLEDIYLTIVRLRIQNLHQSIEELRFLMEDSDVSDESSMKDYLQTMSQYAAVKSRLDQALGQSKTRSVFAG